MKNVDNVYVQDFLLTVVPFLEMFVWFFLLNLTGVFSTSYAPLAAIFVLASFTIDRFVAEKIKKRLGR